MIVSMMTSCELLMSCVYGLAPYVHHEEVMTSKWLSLVFVEVIERWRSLLTYYGGYRMMSMQIMIDNNLHDGCLYGTHYENAHANAL